MKKETISNELLKLITQKLPKVKIDGNQDIRDASIADSLGLDSIELLRLVVELEIYFKVDLPDATLMQIDTFGELVDAIFNAEPISVD